MRHTAWLNTTPEKSSKPRRETRSDEMPPLNEGGYLVRLLFEIGPVHPIGMGGAVAISDQDLIAWQTNQRVRLSPWECAAIRELSRDYAGMLGEAQSANCPPPWLPQATFTVEHRQRVADGLLAWAERFNAQKPQ